MDLEVVGERLVVVGVVDSEAVVPGSRVGKQVVVENPDGDRGSKRGVVLAGLELGLVELRPGVSHPLAQAGLDPDLDLDLKRVALLVPGLDVEHMDLVGSGLSQAEGVEELHRGDGDR